MTTTAHPSGAPPFGRWTTHVLILFVLVATLVSWAYALRQNSDTRSVQQHLTTLDRRLCQQVNLAHQRLNRVIAQESLVVEVVLAADHLPASVERELRKEAGRLENLNRPLPLLTCP